ncbi:branched-chain amino acid ABC transporter permease [Burkholderia multivorans]|uniref:branched-chain amino acid ABC transporter permease n=1 Tax=Burkholderia multivorans TaxID=87883 RepID=UPI001C270E2B|nr:branched-chain amino acid ABC transporter permease [Burkholderia multivorans]MBU9576275.1 branched-chain amino acid ABC transporter permease [Burkholderia multivorans]MDN7953807.1 branched-chain amino acid ABC transporter permease [Burkholderia multivorans]
MKFERNGLLLLGFLAALMPLAIHDQYLVHLGVMVLFYAVLATSFNLVTGYVGEFSLGHTAFLGIGAYTAAILSTRYGLPMWATVPLAGGAAMVAGLVIGAITLRLQGPFFVIVTLSFAEALRLIADNWVSLTNGPMGISGIAQPAWISGLGNFRGTQALYYMVLAIAAIALYLAYRFVYSGAGRAAVTVRENRYVAQSVGIRPFEMAMQAFVLGATMAGVAGGFYAHYISFVGSDVFGFPFMATMIIMVLVGGKGTLLGPIIGALLVTFLQEYLREAQELRLTLFGIFVILIVLFLPRGLMGLMATRLSESKTRNGDVAARRTLPGGTS